MQKRLYIKNIAYFKWISIFILKKYSFVELIIHPIRKDSINWNQTLYSTEYYYYSRCSIHIKYENMKKSLSANFKKSLEK